MANTTISGISGKDAEAQDRRVAGEAARGVPVAGAHVGSDDGAMSVMTPTASGESRPVAPDSRLSELRATPAAERGTLVNLVYVGRKASTVGFEAKEGTFVHEEGEEDDEAVASIVSPVGEHIDVVIPSRRNLAQAATYLNMASPTGIRTEQERQQLADAGLSPETLHIGGRSLHFTQGEVTPVQPHHAAWLKNHETYAFKEVEG